MRVKNADIYYIPIALLFSMVCICCRGCYVYDWVNLFNEPSHRFSLRYSMLCIYADLLEYGYLRIRYTRHGCLFMKKEEVYVTKVVKLTLKVKKNGGTFLTFESIWLFFFFSLPIFFFLLRI